MTMGDDEEAQNNGNNNNGRAVASSTGTAAVPKVFPLPQVVLTIFCPKTFTTTQDKIARHVAWKRYSMSGGSTPSTSNLIKIRLSSILMKMLQKFIEEGLVPQEAVQILVGHAHYAFVQILCSSSVLPSLIKRCERIGIGTAVGCCYATRLETSNMPAPGQGLDKAQMLEQMSTKRSSDQTAGSTMSSMIEQLNQEERISSVTRSDGMSLMKEEESAMTLTLDDDILNDDVKDSGSGNKSDGEAQKDRLTEAISIPFVSEEKIKELRERIVAARKEWLQTASRVRVEQVAEQIGANAACTYDYLMYVICAAIVAAVGLGTDSATTTIASMLISPIMGPVMGFTFGTMIRKKRLIFISLRNELFSLFVCVVVGGIFGVLAAVSNVPQNRDWPTAEMLARGDESGLVSGIFIALPSGVATALSTLGNNSSGMTGVAISLSLLPPAVNAGICWMYGAMLSTGYTPNEGDDTDYIRKGNISISLTLVNIICIWLAGVFMFWLKEVAPVEKKNAFWLRDLKEYRFQIRRRKAMADTDVINDGVQAALELRQELGEDILEEDFSGINEKKIGATRRAGLAQNSLEDALFFDNDFGMKGEIYAGGAAADAFDDTTLENVRMRKNRRKSVADLVQNANQGFGGLSTAGQALFDSRLIGDADDFSLATDTDGVDHEAVAQKILLQKYD